MGGVIIDRGKIRRGEKIVRWGERSIDGANQIVIKMRIKLKMYEAGKPHTLHVKNDTW